jgi:hypothetical protein
MAAIDALKGATDSLAAAVAANTAAIDAAVAKLGSPAGVPEADVEAAATVVQALADTVNADAARLASA